MWSVYISKLAEIKLQWCLVIAILLVAHYIKDELSCILNK